MLAEVEFRGNRKEFFQWDGQEPLTVGSYVVVDADRGEDLGKVHSVGDTAAHRNSSCAHGCGTDTPQQKVLRVASTREVKQGDSLARLNEEARRKATQKVHESGLVMKISDAEWQWDKKKLTLYFTADKRVDFRNLVRELAATFRTRIELKQIGVRDEAKRLDGIGRCGRQYCSASWLPELRPVNLGVAKDQRLSLNPAQISGACGRLMCCLRYEHEFYVESRKRFPKEGRYFMTERGQERVHSVDLFRETVTLTPVSGEGGPILFSLSEFNDRILNNQPAQQTDAMDDGVDDSQSFEISPDLMYTAEFAIPQPRLVILTEAIDPVEDRDDRGNNSKDGKSSDGDSVEGETKRPKRRRGRSGPGWRGKKREE